MSSFAITTAVNGSSLARLGLVAALAWTRATTTATVTQNTHGMVTGDQINVTVTSDALAITTGLKTVTVLNASTYTFVCLNAGSASGTITSAHIDNYLINGGVLTVDQPTRYGLNQNLYAAFGNIVMSAALGGTIEFNATLVRLIPFNTGASTVPAADTVITQGSASSRLIAVYANLTSAPTAAGAAMPVSGFILTRQWNSVAYTATALTGISATATGPDVVGWLDIIGIDALTATVNRLNTFRVRGSYFEFLGVTTNGARATTYQLPNNGSAQVYIPGVEVETGVGTGVYEFYPCAGTRPALVANIGVDAVRGKWCWVSTAGLIRFGHDGTNSTGGYLPPTGLKIRIPNIFFYCCTALAPTVDVLPNATLATRYKFATTGGGVIDISTCNMNWYCNFAQPFSVALTNTQTFGAIILSECASSIAWSNVGVGQEAANIQTALTMAFNFAGGTMSKCTWTRANQSAGGYVTSWSDCVGFTVTDEKNHCLTKAANATAGTTTHTRVSSSTWTNTVLGGGRVLQVTGTDVTFLNSVYYDNIGPTTGSAIPMFAFDIASSCVRCTYDGLTFGGLDLVQPYSGILQIGSAGCSTIKLRNLGSAASPLDLGGAAQDSTWTRATTTATVTTTVAHNLKTGDIIFAPYSSDVAAITTGAKTLLSAPTPTTYTFTCLSAGAASGTLVGYATMSSLVCAISASAAANDVLIQRVYTQRTRTGVITGDNSSKNIKLESVWASDWSALVNPLLNATIRGVVSLPSLAAQTSVYGTHFADFYTTGPATNVAAVAWTRATTTATVTSTAHRLKTGNFVNVTVTSDAAAIVLGQKTITALTADTFTFTCLNAGAASGTLTFVPFSSLIAIQMNEATTETASQVTLASGAAFTSAGGLYMPTISQQADFTAPSNIRGHSSFPIAEAVMAGGTLANYDVTVSLDAGVTYINLAYTRTGAGGSAASQNVTMTSTTGVAVDDFVFGTGIAPNAKVSSITNGTTVVVNIANIGTVSGTLRFNALPSRTVADAVNVGFPLRIRIRTAVTNATAITSLLFYTDSTQGARGAQYPLDVNTITFTGLVSGSDVVVLIAGTTTILQALDSIVGTTSSFTYSGAQNVDVGFIKTGYVPLYIRNIALVAANSSIPVAQTPDRNFI